MKPNNFRLRNVINNIIFPETLIIACLASFWLFLINFFRYLNSLSNLPNITSSELAFDSKDWQI